MAKTNPKNEEMVSDATIFSPGPGWKVIELTVWEPEVGEHITGIYKGSENVKSPDPKKDRETFLSHKILVGESNSDAADPELLGKLIAVSGAALNPKFQNLDADSEVCIVYRGLAKSNNKLHRDYKDFTVYTR